MKVNIKSSTTQQGVAHPATAPHLARSTDDASYDASFSAAEKSARNDADDGVTGAAKTVGGRQYRCTRCGDGIGSHENQDAHNASAHGSESWKDAHSPVNLSTYKPHASFAEWQEAQTIR